MVETNDRRLPVGIQSFEKIRKDGYLYVDKTDIIWQLANRNKTYNYLSRPRRFGKSVLVDTLEAYFMGKKELFEGLKIMQLETEWVKRPVIRLDMSRAGAEPDTLRSYLNNIFKQYEEEYSLAPDPTDSLADRFNAIIVGAYEQTGLQVAILIDEYDRAVTDNFGKKSQKDILDFLGDFLCSALKTNANREMAYMTGIMHIAQTSSFSGLNNVSVHNIFSEMGDERFGFTESEVERILKDFGHTEKMGEAKEWYDGYRFGNAEVYNPFSIMSYVSHGFKPEQYWIDSGSTSMITDLLWNVDSQNFEKVVDLVTGGRVETRLDHMLTYGRIMNKDDHLFSLMALSGYLRAVPIGDGRYETSIPNNEVRMAVENLTSSVFPVDTGYFGQFVRATIDGDAATMEETFQDILLHGNYLNLKENAYEVIMMTLMHSLVKRYNVRTEHKSGFGRTDIVLEPRNDGDQYRIFELKVSRSADRLESDAKEAIEQIHRERYHLGMPGEVVLYGISFYGNTLKVLIEKVQDGRDNVLR